MAKLLNRASLGFSDVAVIAVAAGSLYLLGLAIYRAFFHPLRKYPGPFILRITHLPMSYNNIRGRSAFYVASLFDKYGPVVRLGPDNVGFIDAAAWKDIYGHKPGGHFEKVWEVYRQDAQKGPINILNAYSEEHAMLRKWTAPNFSDRAMREQEPMIGGYVDLLMKRLGDHCQKGQIALNLRDWYTFTTFDVIGKLMFSDDFGCLETSDYHPWVKMVSFMSREGMLLGELKRNVSKTLVAWLGKTRFAKNRLKHAQETKKKLTKRMESGKQPDIMEDLLHNRDGVDIPLDRLHSNAMLFIIAGSETTATLLCGVTYLLLTNPDSYNKVVEEVRSSYSAPEEITLTSVTKLTYMLACLNEALRFYPPVAGSLPRQVVKGSATVAGNVLPEGTMVGAWQYPMYHSEYNFTAPEEYHPERFLGDPKFAGDKLDVLQPFSIGPRDCIGRNLSYAEMRLILARILFTFDLKLADDSRHWMHEQKMYFLWRKPDLNVYLTPVTR
ncbi:cytochrome P450 ClCP1 [Xylariales sp. AK1849]|nr:cytochrome P450 ClCP1 [Xylariales sp. AK1849]